MNPKKVEVEVRTDTAGKFRVYVNSVCVGVFFESKNAEDFIVDIKGLNQNSEFIRISAI